MPEATLPLTHHPRYLAMDDVRDIAMQAAYLMAGYVQQVKRTGVPLLQENFGQLHVVDRLTELAVVVHDYLQTPRMKQINDDAAWPGVFEYEVTELMGQWFAKHSTATDPAFRTELERMTNEFLGG